MAGKKVQTGEYDALIEMATICAMCNDSSVDFNEVTRMKEKTPKHPVQSHLKQTRVIWQSEVFISQPRVHATSSTDEPSFIIPSQFLRETAQIHKTAQKAKEIEHYVCA